MKFLRARLTNYCISRHVTCKVLRADCRFCVLNDLSFDVLMATYSTLESYYRWIDLVLRCCGGFGRAWFKALPSIRPTARSARYSYWGLFHKHRPILHGDGNIGAIRATRQEKNEKSGKIRIVKGKKDLFLPTVMSKKFVFVESSIRHESNGMLIGVFAKHWSIFKIVLANFRAECASENNIKINYYLAKMWIKVWWRVACVFFDSRRKCAFGREQLHYEVSRPIATTDDVMGHIVLNWPF